MRRVIDAAISEKVDRLLLIGTLYVFGRPQSARVTENHPRESYLLTDPLIVDDSALQELLGGITKTPYSEGVRQSLSAVG